jgi:hypothetical protein
MSLPLGVPTGTVRREIAPGQWQILGDNPSVGPGPNQYYVDGYANPPVGIGHKPFTQVTNITGAPLSLVANTITALPLTLSALNTGYLTGAAQGSSGWQPTPAPIGTTTLTFVGMQYANVSTRLAVQISPSGAQTAPTGYTSSFLRATVVYSLVGTSYTNSLSRDIIINSTTAGSGQNVMENFDAMIPYNSAATALTVLINLDYNTGGTTTLTVTDTHGIAITFTQ